MQCTDPGQSSGIPNRPLRIKKGWYANRSEAIRDVVRNIVERKQLARLEAAVEEDIQ
ncbi:MAG: hypothetical protein HF976_03355 [ANME-2 cluster archaeon]|nr:hypothetical protein [ANME-2 cluster archaeon]